MRSIRFKYCYPTAEYIFQIEQAGRPRQPRTESAENDSLALSTNFITQSFTNGYRDGSGTEIAILFDYFVRSLAQGELKAPHNRGDNVLVGLVKKDVVHIRDLLVSSG